VAVRAHRDEFRCVVLGSVQEYEADLSVARSAVTTTPPASAEWIDVVSVHRTSTRDTRPLRKHLSTGCSTRLPVVCSVVRHACCSQLGAQPQYGAGMQLADA
jgi:hypothetical protein